MVAVKVQGLELINKAPGKASGRCFGNDRTDKGYHQVTFGDMSDKWWYRREEIHMLTSSQTSLPTDLSGQILFLDSVRKDFEIHSVAVLQDLALELNFIFQRQKGYNLIRTGTKEDLRRIQYQRILANVETNMLCKH